jgi:O-acetyl-ADP-ribose deacetylase (regulator of RNase III)
MKEVSGNYFYSPNIKTNSNDGDGFYSAGTSTEDAVKDFYKKYLELKEKLKKYDINIEDDAIENENYEDEEEYSPMYDNYEERQVDMLSLPVYYHIAFAIPADLSFGSATARQIDAFYGLRDKLEKAVEKYEDECEDLETGWLKAGDTICIENIFVMLTTNKKYQRPTLDTIRNCVRVIAEECYENKIRYLAMPRVGCGHGHLNWDVVKEAILDEFDNYFDEMNEEEYRPFITFCYQ